MVQLASQRTFFSSSRRMSISPRPADAYVRSLMTTGYIAHSSEVNPAQAASSVCFLRRQEHLSARRRQLCHLRARPRRRRRRVRLGVQAGVGEPGIELLAAACRRGWGRLWRQLGTAGRTDQPDRKVVVVAPPRLHLAEPVAVAAGLAAE